MQQEELQKYHIDLPVDSPLHKVRITGTDSEIYLKREDLISPAGGNKVRRLFQWFTSHINSHTVVAMSDPGAHTFKVLKAFFDSNIISSKVKRMIFLETLRKTNPYSAKIKQEYSHDKRIRVIGGPAISQFLLLKLLGLLPGFASLGVGGSVKSAVNPFTRALEEVHESPQFLNFDGRVTHIFPIASGTMLDGFLLSPILKKKDIRFIGVMSGNPITYRLLKRKYCRNSSCILKPSKSIQWSIYLDKAHTFFEETGVWLDPLHTIHLLDAIENFHGNKTERKVMWITNPKIITDPSYLKFIKSENG